MRANTSLLNLSTSSLSPWRMRGAEANDVHNMVERSIHNFAAQAQAGRPTSSGRASPRIIGEETLSPRGLMIDFSRGTTMSPPMWKWLRNSSHDLRTPRKNKKRLSPTNALSTVHASHRSVPFTRNVGNARPMPRVAKLCIDRSGELILHSTQLTYFVPCRDLVKHTQYIQQARNIQTTGTTIEALATATH